MVFSDHTQLKAGDTKKQALTLAQKQIENKQYTHAIQTLKKTIHGSSSAESHYTLAEHTT